MTYTLADGNIDGQIIYSAATTRAEFRKTTDPWTGENLEIWDFYLSSESPVAHVPHPSLEKNGMVSVQTLFGSSEKISSAQRAYNSIQRARKENMKVPIVIGTEQHPVRYSSARGLVILTGGSQSERLNDTFALLNIRANYAPTDGGGCADIGGYAKHSSDIFSPEMQLRREFSEKVLFFSNDMKTQYISSNFVASEIMKGQADITMPEKRFRTEKRVHIWQHGNAYRNTLVRAHLDGKKVLHKPRLGVNFEPSANCGIDFQQFIEVTLEHHPTKIQYGFGLHFPGKGGKQVITGPDNDMLLVRLDDLVEEFDKGDAAKSLTVYRKNAFTGRDEEQNMILNKHSLNGSVLNQLRCLKDNG